MKKRNVEEISDPLLTPLENVEPIIIDGITFFARGRTRARERESEIVTETGIINQYYDNYDKIVIISVDDKGIRQLFWAYQSNSELGIWRLCGSLVHRGDHIFNKLVDFYGKYGIDYGDYVQSTLLHIKLQEYLTQVKPRLPVLEQEFPEVRKDAPFKGLKRFEDSTTCTEFSEEMLRIINPNIREIHSYPFSMFGEREQCGHIVPQERFIEFSNEFEKYYEIATPPQTTDISVSETPEGPAADAENNEVVIYRNYERMVGTTRFNREENITGIKVFGDVMEMSLRLKERLPSQFTADMVADNIKLIFLQTRKNGIQLYHGTIPIPYAEGAGMPDPNENYYMPIALIPIIPGTPECTVYGVYRHYIRSGIFICKLFDYQFQCRPEEQERQLCMGIYNFIGDRYRGIFPFNTLSHKFSLGTPSTSPRSPRLVRQGSKKTLPAHREPRTSGGGTKKQRRRTIRRHKRTHRRRTSHRPTRRRRRQ